MDVVNERCAGLDIHRDTVVSSVIIPEALPVLSRPRVVGPDLPRHRRERRQALERARTSPPSTAGSIDATLADVDDRIRNRTRSNRLVRLYQDG